MLEHIVRGPLLIPREDGSAAFYFDGVLAADPQGILKFAGPFKQLAPLLADQPIRQSDGVMLPPLLDIHIHVPQHAIRGRFTEGVSEDAGEGTLLAGLKRNVFPAEAKCAAAEFAERAVREFLTDTLSHGVVGGAAYMTPSALATEIALSILPSSWSVGLVLMNQNCPVNLRTDEATLEQDIERLAKRFGRRLIVTDRFAVAVDSSLRQKGSTLAGEFNLRTQTHLNEQKAEKHLIETELYPNYANYTDVYFQDGLLDHQCIVAHCLQMTDEEWRTLRSAGATIAHCPTSNLLLRSGVMPLDDVKRWQIPYALATDVGASPTVSMLAEMQRFLQVHAGKSDFATAEEALYRSTRAPADLMELSKDFGRLEEGAPMSFIEVEASGISALDVSAEMSPDQVVRALLPEDPDHPSATVRRVTIGDRVAFIKGRE